MSMIEQTGERITVRPTLTCCGRPIQLSLRVVVDDDGDEAVLHEEVHQALRLHLRSCDP